MITTISTSHMPQKHADQDAPSDTQTNIASKGHKRACPAITSCHSLLLGGALLIQCRPLCHTAVHTHRQDRLPLLCAFVHTHSSVAARSVRLSAHPTRWVYGPYLFTELGQCASHFESAASGTNKAVNPAWWINSRGLGFQVRYERARPRPM